MKINKKTNILLTISSLGLLVLTVVSGHILTLPGVSAEESVTSSAKVTVTSSCQIGAEVDSEHEAEIVASTYRDNIGKTTITASCNDANGYAVYAVGYTNTEFGRNSMLGASTGYTIETGTAISGTDSNWAMKLTSVPGSVAPTIADGYDDYHSVPDDYVKVASYDNSTMKNNTGSQFETTYAAYISSMQAPDIYNGKVKYTLVHPNDSASAPCAETYTILYSANGGSGNMDSQEACVDTAIRLLPDGFTPPTPVSENKFAVWNTSADGSGYTYSANQSVTNIASAGGTITLYAQWAPKYMQDLTNSVCQTTASIYPITVYDRRDGSDYTVRYLGDTCWMTQNLRITGTINKQNSNFSRVENFDPCIGDLTDGDSYNEPRCHESGNKTNGVWYNFAAASAGQTTGKENYTPSTEDICPANWSLPSYAHSGGAGTIGSITTSSIPEAVTLFSSVGGGDYQNGSIANPTNGYWWSSMNNGVNPRYVLQYNGTGQSTTWLNRQYGVYIRCVRKLDP